MRVRHQATVKIMTPSHKLLMLLNIIAMAKGSLVMAKNHKDIATTPHKLRRTCSPGTGVASGMRRAHIMADSSTTPVIPRYSTISIEP